MPHPVPVLMYHKVGPEIPGWNWAYLAIPVEVFADHLAALDRAGWRTATLDELGAHVRGERTLPPRTVVLTFDDGYVDNWTLAAPLLRRHGFGATVFVNPDFVDPRDIVRETLDETRDPAACEHRGFMSWPELKRASDAGVLSIQSHLVTHTWYPVGTEVVDWHRPGDGHYWLDWNADPARKPFYLDDPTASRVPWGTPVYRHDKAARAWRLSVDPAEARHMAEFTADEGGAALFARPAWRTVLETELARWRTIHPPAVRAETEAERLERLAFEIRGSKRLIEERLGREVPFMAWPGGGYDDEATALAREVYRATTIGSWDPRRDDARNLPGGDPRVIGRLGVPTLERGGRHHYPGGRYLVQFLDEFRGVRLARRKRQALKAFLMAGLRLRHA